MRTLVKTPEYWEFYNSLNEKVQEKVKYILLAMEELPIVHSKFVKKLENTDFYEMRISVDNEYRVILFTVDHVNFAKATQVYLLNGFIKKSTKDYRAQIAKANSIIQRIAAQPLNDEEIQNIEKDETRN